jgi:hypothetical protein
VQTTNTEIVGPHFQARNSSGSSGRGPNKRAAEEGPFPKARKVRNHPKVETMIHPNEMQKSVLIIASGKVEWWVQANQSVKGMTTTKPKNAATAEEILINLSIAVVNLTSAFISVFLICLLHIFCNYFRPTLACSRLQGQRGLHLRRGRVAERTYFENLFDHVALREYIIRHYPM